MKRRHLGRRISGIVIVAAFAVSCGGGDSDDDASSGPTDTEATDTEATDAVASDAAATTLADTGDDESDSSAGVDTTNCDAIFSMAEIEEFFAEPAALSEETDDSLGRLLCNWESIEDPDDLDDLAFKVLTVQLFSGDPIDAAAFVDPSVFETVRTIDGIGDLAFATEDLGLTFGFVDEPVSGLLSYTESDMGNADAPNLRTADDVEQLFRTFHERVT